MALAQLERGNVPLRSLVRRFRMTWDHEKSARRSQLSVVRDKPLATVSPPIQAALDHIVENYRWHISLDDLASIAAMSKFHFLRRFSEEVGMPPGALLRRCRLSQAMKLLSGTQYEVRDVAEKVGYRSAASFSRAFHEVVGTQPTVYRRRVSPV